MGLQKELSQGYAWSFFCSDQKRDEIRAVFDKDPLKWQDTRDEIYNNFATAFALIMNTVQV